MKTTAYATAAASRSRTSRSRFRPSLRGGALSRLARLWRACELVAGFLLRALIRWCFGVNASVEGKLDLAVWPELLPTSIAVMLHVLQNMLFSIIRLHFH